MAKAHIIEGEHPLHGKLYAAIDGEAKYVQGRVCELRFACLLSPYKTLAEAEAGLIEAGAIVPEGGARWVRFRRWRTGTVAASSPLLL